MQRKSVTGHQHTYSSTMQYMIVISVNRTLSCVSLMLKLKCKLQWINTGNITNFPTTEDSFCALKCIAVLFSYTILSKKHQCCQLLFKISVFSCQCSFSSVFQESWMHIRWKFLGGVRFERYSLKKKVILDLAAVLIKSVSTIISSLAVFDGFTEPI